MSKYGDITISKNHTLSRTPYGFQMSPYLQEIVVYCGQSRVFEDASQELEKLLGLQVPAKQVERLTHAYGELLENSTQSEQEELPSQRDDLHYCMMDGGMILTREDDWKEMKLARIFPAQAHMAESEKRNFIKESQYVAHLGGHHPFLRKVELQTDHLRNMVWLCDGAKWIWSWITSTYPESIQILDYFHCNEKLNQFALLAIKDDKDRKEWVEQQKDLLFEDEVNTVIANISLIPCKGKAVEAQRTLLTYYENNKQKMKYGTYKKQGLLIGSGPMEAAHRHVVQCRLKLSGQRWTINGAQQVVNLRVANKSGQWNKIIELANLN